MIKGMQQWVDYIAEQLNVSCETTPWGVRYTVPPESGHGYMESFGKPGEWVVWRCDFAMNKALHTTYMQDDPYYIAFGYRETTFTAKVQDASWPSNEIINFQSLPGMAMRGIGAFFFTSFFEGLADRDVMDFIASVQSYSDDTLMKLITPVLRQMLDTPASGLPLRLFMESRMLEIASILMDVSEKEQTSEKVSLSAFDTGQLHKVLEILEERMADPPGISELARMAALNEFKLKVGFRQLFGMTIYEYLRLLRMEKAANLLRDRQLSSAEVGQKVGYRTPHGFNNAFRKYYGTTPTEWQKRQR